MEFKLRDPGRFQANVRGIEMRPDFDTIKPAPGEWEVFPALLWPPKCHARFLVRFL